VKRLSPRMQSAWRQMMTARRKHKLPQHYRGDLVIDRDMLAEHDPWAFGWVLRTNGTALSIIAHHEECVDTHWTWDDNQVNTVELAYLSLNYWAREKGSERCHCFLFEPTTEDLIHFATGEALMRKFKELQIEAMERAQVALGAAV
jgi:hypothetical protein